MRQSELLAEAFYLINEFVRDLPQCSCHESYKSRNLTDPHCTHCDALGDDIFNGMVAWCNKVICLTSQSTRIATAPAQQSPQANKDTGNSGH